MRTALSTAGLTLAAIGVLSTPATPGVGDPMPLRGAPLRDGTGLRLVVADNPPFVLDVDTGRVTRVPGVRSMNRGTLAVVGVGGSAAVVVARSVWRRADLYSVHGRTPRVSALGTGTDVVAAGDGRSVWIKAFAGASRCTLRRVGLDGRVLRAPRAFRCASTIYPAGWLGLVVNRTRVIDPATGRTVLTTPWGILAAAGRQLVLVTPDKKLTLLDARARVHRRLPWPSILPWLETRPAVDPRGRYVALAFAAPAWEGGNQVLDVWLLAVETGKLTHVPGMPAFVSLKRTSLAWTHDGRLAMLGETNQRAVVALWRPGQRRLAVKTVKIPERTSGSDSFAPLGG